MPPRVHVLATCRQAELLPATLLVFKTIRVGFPTAEITVWWNGQMNSSCKERTDTYQAASAALCGDPKMLEGGFHWWDYETIHHKWIERLLSLETEPFFICDTDLCLWDSVEQFDFGDSALAGRYTPQFHCRFVNAITRPRLHTCLLWMNPQRIKEETAKYFAQFPETPFNPRPNLIYPQFHPERTGNLVKTYFHDTASMLYQAIGGQSFTDAQNDCFDHCSFGTLSDLVGPSYYPQEPFRQQHFAVFDNPQILKGAWRTDAAFYAANAAT